MENYTPSKTLLYGKENMGKLGEKKKKGLLQYPLQKCPLEQQFPYSVAREKEREKKILLLSGIMLQGLSGFIPLGHKTPSVTVHVVSSY